MILLWHHLKFILLGALISFPVYVLHAVEYKKYNHAKMQILNKITGKTATFDLPTNTIFHFDNKLSLILKACYKTTQNYSPEDVVFLQVAKAANNISDEIGLQDNIHVLTHANDYLKNQEGYNADGSVAELAANIDNNITSQLIFSGWIFSNHQEISGLSDAVYDISIIKCL